MESLPSGTVTLLFSDIEGSTVALSRLGGRWGDALGDHRALLRRAFSEHDGHEMGTEGDSFFVVFATAGQAVLAAVAAQQALAGHDWPDDAPLRVRMGLHTGEPTRLEDGYIGLDVHVGARIAGTAHGGQVVLSDATAGLVKGHLPSGVTLRDLGPHRLKDLPEPVRLHQLVVPGLPTDFPPLRSLGALTNLPVPATPLVDRRRPLATTTGLLADPVTRLVTVTGPGGAGKTRLAVAASAAVAAEFPDGTFFVELGAAADAEMLWGAVADVVGAGGEGSPRERALSLLRPARALLVLDNLEQVEGAGQAVTAALASAPAVTVLATSRRALRVPGEHVVRLPALAHDDAVELFVQHARMARADFELTGSNAAAVAAVAERLEGLPLAIELAASRVRLLGPAALLRRLDDRLALGDRVGERPSRQRTLRDAIAWSHDLLAPELQAAFRRMGVFAGGADLAATAAVVGVDEAGAADVAEELVDVSLAWVRDGPDGEPRVGMLDTVRDFALEQLVGHGELDEVRLRHAEHYAAVVADVLPELQGAPGLAHLDRLDAERDNLREALRYCLDEARDDRLELGLRLVDAMTTYWYRRGHVVEARGWLEKAVARTAGVDTEPVAEALHGLGVFLEQQRESAAALEVFQRALATWRRLGDRRKEARELNSIGVVHLSTGDPDTARGWVSQALQIAREVGRLPSLSTPLNNLALVEVDAGNPDAALTLLQEALSIDSELGDAWAVVVDRVNLLAVLLRAERLDEVAREAPSLVDDVLGLGELDLVAGLAELVACLAAASGDAERAAMLMAAGERLRRDIGVPLAQNEIVFTERFVGPARAEVPRERWDDAWQQGWQLTREQLVTLMREPVAVPPTAPART